jgi:hypothetical protein
MSDEEIVTNNLMEVELVPTIESSLSSSPLTATSGIVLDLDIGSGHISGSDDEDIKDPLPSKSSTPDSITLPTVVTRKPTTTRKPPLTKSRSFYFRIKCFGNITKEISLLFSSSR